MNNTKSSLFMVLAMGAFSIEDMLVKGAANAFGIGVILILFGLGGTLIFMFLINKRGERILHPAILSPPILIRACCEVTGRLAFIFAITLTALSSASAILQATPLMTIIGASILFGEKVGYKRWVAVLIGFIGVLMIIRPGLASFEMNSLFAVLATIGFAGRDLATRGAPAVLSNMQLGFCGFFVLIPTGSMLHLYNGQPVQFDLIASLQVLGAIIFGVAAYNALTIAMRNGDISVVSPFRYTRLLFALIIGVFIFHESVDLITILGSLLIIISGSYTLINSRN